MPGTDPAEFRGELFRRVARVINAMRPMIQADGGDVELVDLTDANTVKIRLHGACVGCPSEPNAVFLDPLFVDVGLADFRLRDDSPAVDTGVDLGIDLNGPAPGNWSGSGPDIGALEAD